MKAKFLDCFASNERKPAKSSIPLHRVMRAVVALSLASSLSGCGTSWFSDPKTNPVIEDHVNAGLGPLSTLATTPERRVVLINTIDKDPNNQNNPHRNYGRFCAEPPADVAESISSTLQAALTAAVQSPTGPSAEGGVELDKSLATAVQSLTQRSQGITLFRDGGYNLCAMLLNDFITQQQYLERWDKLLAVSVELATFELDKNAGKIGSDQPASLSAPEQRQLKALLEDYWKNRGSVLAKPPTEKDQADQTGTTNPGS